MPDANASASITLGNATVSAHVANGRFGFAWVPPGTAWSNALYRWDERIVGLTIEHIEGNFATLTIDLKNPKVGLLAAGRNQWAWLSRVRDDLTVVPEYFGRLVGVPENLHLDVVRLTFIARPVDYEAQRAALAAALRVLPYWDPIWLQQDLTNDDTVLETYPLAWHIGRTDLTVTTSDLLSGEDGTLDVAASEHLYNQMTVSYAGTPKRSIAIQLQAQWTQRGEGDVVITNAIVAAFAAVNGSPMPGVIVSFSGDGLIGDWPKAGANIGGGWTVASGSIEQATWLPRRAYSSRYIAQASSNPGTGAPPTLVQTLVNPYITGWSTWEFTAPAWYLKPSLTVHYTAARQRTEQVTATVTADIQSILVDPGAAETDTVSLSSTYVDQPVDAGGALPIGDPGQNTYFKLPRGAQSFEYALLKARNELVTSARAVDVTFWTTWEKSQALSCRWSVLLHDNRLPAGQALGKVKTYRLIAGAGDLHAEVTIGCAIGYDNALADAAAGTPVYVEDGVLEDGIQARTGAVIPLLPNVLHYQSFDDFTVTDDDGVNLFAMTPETVINSITVTNGPNAQKAAIDAGILLQPPDPQTALQNAPTAIAYDLKPVDGGAFLVDYDPEVSLLVIPKMIDLEAAAL